MQSKEVHSLVDVYLVRRECAYCGNSMEFIHLIDKDYIHKCVGCGVSENLEKKYPYPHYVKRR